MAKKASKEERAALEVAMATLTNGRGIAYKEGDTIEYENYDKGQTDAKEAVIKILHNGILKIIKLRNIVSFGFNKDSNDPVRQVDSTDIINQIMDGKTVTITKTGLADGFASKGQDEEIEGGINWRGKWYNRGKDTVITVLEIKAK